MAPSMKLASGLLLPALVASAEQGRVGSKQGAPEQEHFTGYMQEYLPAGDYHAYVDQWAGDKAQWRDYVEQYAGSMANYTGYMQKYGGQQADYDQYVNMYASMAGSNVSSGSNWQGKEGSQRGAWSRSMSGTMKKYVPGAYQGFGADAMQARAESGGNGGYQQYMNGEASYANTSGGQGDQQKYARQYEKQYAGQYQDYQKYMPGQNQRYRQYTDKYAGDYGKYASGGQGGYQQYMHKYADKYMKQYASKYDKYYKKYMYGQQGNTSEASKMEPEKSEHKEEAKAEPKKSEHKAEADHEAKAQPEKSEHKAEVKAEPKKSEHKTEADREAKAEPEKSEHKAEADHETKAEEGTPKGAATPVLMDADSLAATPVVLAAPANTTQLRLEAEDALQRMEGLEQSLKRLAEDEGATQQAAAADAEAIVEKQHKALGHVLSALKDCSEAQTVCERRAEEAMKHLRRVGERSLHEAEEGAIRASRESARKGEVIVRKMAEEVRHRADALARAAWESREMVDLANKMNRQAQDTAEKAERHIEKLARMRAKAFRHHCEHAKRRLEHEIRVPKAAVARKEEPEKRAAKEEPEKKAAKEEPEKKVAKEEPEKAAKKKPEEEDRTHRPAAAHFLAAAQPRAAGASFGAALVLAAVAAALAGLAALRYRRPKPAAVLMPEYVLG